MFRENMAFGVAHLSTSDISCFSSVSLSHLISSAQPQTWTFLLASCVPATAASHAPPDCARRVDGVAERRVSGLHRQIPQHPLVGLKLHFIYLKFVFIMLNLIGYSYEIMTISMNCAAVLPVFNRVRADRVAV